MKFASTLLAVTLTAALLTTAAVAQAAIEGLVYQTTNVRSGPDTRFPIVGQLSEGDRVQIDGQNADGRWLRVVMTAGDTGWLPVFALVIDEPLDDVPVVEAEAESTPPADAPTDVSVVSYGRVNVRSGPGIIYTIVAQLDVDDSAPAIARSSRGNDWLLIRVDETEGWVAYFTVNVQGNVESLPVLVPDSSGEALVPPARVLRTRFNVRLHDQPQLESDVVLVVPFDSEVTAIGRSSRGDWLFVGFGEETGWGVAQLFSITRSELAALPVYGQIERPPTITPESSSSNAD